jgi:hypothetical protein
VNVRRCAFAGFFVLLIASGGISMPRAAAQEPVVEAVSSDGVFTAKLELFVKGSPEQVFAVITDYEHLHTLDRRIKESRVLERPAPNEYLVYTRTKACMLFFCRSLKRVERVTEVPHTSVEAVAIAEQSDLLDGRSTWHLVGENGGTRLSFETTFRPAFWVPGMAGRSALKRTLRSTARAIVREVEQRSVSGDGS